MNTGRAAIVTSVIVDLVNHIGIEFEYCSDSKEPQPKSRVMYGWADLAYIGDYKNCAVYSDKFNIARYKSDSNSPFHRETSNILLGIEQTRYSYLPSEFELLIKNLRERRQFESDKLQELKSIFQTDFLGAHAYWHKHLSCILTEKDFFDCRIEFVRTWAGIDDEWKLDDEQASAVAECGSHIQVTARAGSG